MYREITFDELVAHWHRDPKSGKMALVSRFGFNVTNFTTHVGVFTKNFFQRSFFYGGFYGTGNKWAPRKSRRHTHALLVETGTLAGTFSGGMSYERETGVKAIKRGRSKVNAQYIISTNEKDSRPFPEKKRKERRASRKFYGYAAFHNSDPAKVTYRVNQYSNDKPTQRQFMGHNKTLYDHIKAVYIPMIFEDFP